MSGVTVATMIRSICAPSIAGLFERLARGGKAQVRERLLGRRDPALADAGALADPLVVRCPSSSRARRS